MKLIDADEVIVNFCFEWDDIAPTKEEVIAFLKKQPDAVVQCRECTAFERKGAYHNGAQYGYCYHWDYEPGMSPNKVDGDDFCSYGERRSPNENHP